MKLSGNVTLDSTITHAPIGSDDARIKHGLVMSALGVLGFSFSLPATRLAVPELGAVNVGLGRAVIAGVLAVILLAVRRERFPGREHWRSLAIIASTVVVGFPLLCAYAMQTVSVSHGSVIQALVPLATAIIGTLLTKERPSMAFWIASVVGMLIALGSAATRSHGSFGLGDVVLLFSVGVVALGYVEGGKLSVELEGWRVISWALVIALPVNVLGVLYAYGADGVPDASPTAWLSLVYVGVFSMFVSFFAWYRGLAEAGIARASQVQLVQPILGVAWAVLLLGEEVEAHTWLAACAVLVCVRLATMARMSPRHRSRTGESACAERHHG